MNYAEAVARKSSNNILTVEAVRDLLGDHRGVTLAGITTVTDVKVAAAHKARNIVKISEASVQLFNVLQDKDAYGKAVKRSAARDSSNDPADVAAQKTQDNYYEHDPDCHSIVYHRTTREPYLYLFYNSGRSTYLVDGVVQHKEVVAQYLQPAAARDLLQPTKTFNVTDNIHHDVVVRVLKMASVVELRAMKQVLTV
jgi:hypothetical protein